MPDKLAQIIEALRSYKQADEEGIMVIVSRRACEEAASGLEAVRDIIDAYDFCTVDPVDRGYSVLDSAISEARTLLSISRPERNDIENK